MNPSPPLTDCFAPHVLSMQSAYTREQASMQLEIDCQVCIIEVNLEEFHWHEHSVGTCTVVKCNNMTWNSDFWLKLDGAS